MSVTAAPRSGSVQLVLVVLRVTLGILFLSVWGSNLHKGLYSPDGYAALIRSYVEQGDAPAFWKDLMRLVADHADLFSKLQLATELLFGIALVLGVATRLIGFSAGAFLSALWLSEVGVPNEWIWSLVFPALTAFALSLLSAGRVLGIDALFLDRPPFNRLPGWASG